MNGRRVVRFIWFGITIVIGLVLGLLAGWSRTIQTSDTSFSGLRQDYQIDMVLMTAEIYNHDHNIGAAQTRLDSLKPDDLLQFVQQAALDAEKIGYAAADIKMMNRLAEDLDVALNSRTGGS
ncbi:MAG: hypothetical protein AAGU05_07425 [Anaerolineaceae bacterium]